MKIHPIADLFPMLPEDELKDLADDIAKQGLLHPIMLAMLDGDECILDGRNRYEACQLAGVEPRFTPFVGDDPVGYVLAANITRRHMSKGQQAMVLARAIKSGALKQSIRRAEQASGISNSRIAYANVVLEYAPGLADSVLSGTLALDEAYKKARECKDEAAEAERLLTELRDGAPDLADQVTDGQLTPREAFKAWRDREALHERQRRQRSETATARLCDYVWHVAQWRGGRAADYAWQFDPAFMLPGRTVTWQTLLDARTAIDDMIAVFEERGLAKGGQP
jgi:ParB-like chromosome segregation protein Spo0J